MIFASKAGYRPAFVGGLVTHLCCKNKHLSGDWIVPGVTTESEKALPFRSPLDFGKA
jgi:hypothetical protein